MSVLATRPITRWLVPAVAAVAVLGGGAAIGAITAAADPSLPPRDAKQLLVDLQTARVDGLSGTIVQSSDLGLPALPVGGQGSSDLTSLLAGTHTLRVWYSGPDKARIAVMGTLGETDVITNGTDVWVWSSKENKATHTTLPAGGLDKGGLDKGGLASGGPAKGGLPGGVPSIVPSLGSMTPQQLADAALKLLGLTTEVSTDKATSIAGRDAYELILAPRDPASLIGSVRLAVDATEHVPLRVQVFARGAASPAIEVKFTQISFNRPSAEQFTFNPPPGATVEDATKPSGQPAPSVAPSTSPDQKPPFAAVGSGWTTVLVTKLPARQDASQDPLQTFLTSLPSVSGAWGSGHVLTTNLVSALVTDDGRLLIGAVRPDMLFKAAADPAAKLTK